MDADIIKDADRFKMDLLGGLERTLHGPVKPSTSPPPSHTQYSTLLTLPVITQCSMRHLYASSSEPGMPFVIDKAKTYERRRCGHRPEDFPEPLSTTDCLRSVVDPKESKTNKHRYVVAANDETCRKTMRGVLGVPLVYIKRSVMIMEPMAQDTRGVRGREESGKFREGLKRGSKRKREQGEGEGGEKNVGEDGVKKNAKKAPGPKGPNPLSVRKAKKVVEGQAAVDGSSDVKAKKVSESGAAEESELAKGKRKRIRKHKSGAGDEGDGDAIADAVAKAISAVERAGGDD